MMNAHAKNCFLIITLICALRLTAQSDLLNNSTEDGSFSTYSVSQTDLWTPTLKPGNGFWGTDGANGSRTSVRVHNTTSNVNYNSAFHYLQLCMDENNNGSNYVWRKLSGLVSGRNYTFSYYKCSKSAVADKLIQFAIVTSPSEIIINNSAGGENSIVNALNGIDTLRFNVESTYSKQSYTFTVPEGKTEVYAVWVRSNKVLNSGTNVSCRMFVDDLSLTESTSYSLDSLGVHPSILFNASDFTKIKNAIALRKEPHYSTFLKLKSYCDTYLSYTPIPYTGAVTDDFYEKTLLPASIARNMAVAYCLTKNIAYAQKSAQILNAFSNAMAGNAPIDNAVSLKIARATFPFVCAYDMLLDTEVFGVAEKNQIAQYFRIIENKVKVGVQEWEDNDYFSKQYYNNHLVSHAMSLLAIGCALDDASLIQYIIDSESCPRDVVELQQGLILMSNDIDCVRVQNLPKDDGEIMDRYRHITASGRGLQYSTLVLHLFAPIALMCKHRGWDLFQYKAPAGEWLKLSFDYYSDYWRTKDSGIKRGYYGPHAQENARLNAPDDWIGVFDIALGQYPDSKPLQDVTASFNRPVQHMNLLGFTGLFAPIEPDITRLKQVDAEDIHISFVNNNLHIVSEFMSTVKVINLSGIVVLETALQKSNQYDLKLNLIPGVYLVQVNSNDVGLAKKILITN